MASDVSMWHDTAIALTKSHPYHLPIFPPSDNGLACLAAVQKTLHNTDKGSLKVELAWSDKESERRLFYDIMRQYL